MNPNIKILVVTHKPYSFPNDNNYVPIQVGKDIADIALPYLTDNQGENLSAKNPYFCELTALYWAWQNHFFDNVAYGGLVHYRRYFTGRLPFLNRKIASPTELLSYLEQQNIDAIVAKKRNYYIETIYSHYKHAHDIDDLEKVKAIIERLYPDYSATFQQLLNSRKISLYNMFVMRTDLIQAYCHWLFPILFELEKQISLKDRTPYQQRVFGFIAERLFNLWLIHNRLKLKELAVVNIERQNWIKKIYDFLARKLRG